MQYFNPTTSNGYNTPDEMKKVWSVQLDLTKKFQEVCTRHGFRFWMDGGTLLGAVRHHGFIPWDDDIDLAMMRDDYDKLNKIASQEFTYPYFWQTTFTEDAFFCGHAQLRNVETSAIGKSELDKDYCRGIAIDIFILDGVPENAVSYALHRLGTKIVNKATRFIIKHPNIFLSHKTMFRLYEAMFRANKVSKSNQIGYISWKYRHHEVFCKSYYDDTIMLDFANLQLPAPILYKELLCHYYGNDYMMPKMAPNFHGQKYLNAEISYKQIVSELKNNPELFSRQIKLLYQHSVQ